MAKTFDLKFYKQGEIIPLRCKIFQNEEELSEHMDNLYDALDAEHSQENGYDKIIECQSGYVYEVVYYSSERGIAFAYKITINEY